MEAAARPGLRTRSYDALFTAIRAQSTVALHALSPPEIQRSSRRSKLTIPETHTRLPDAGLDSLPVRCGALLDDQLRQLLTPLQPPRAEGPDVMRRATRHGPPTDATTLTCTHGPSHARSGAPARVCARGQNAEGCARICAPDGRVAPGANPHGSIQNIGGSVNREGNVLGMMPHPERCAEPELGGTDGLRLFRSVVNSFTGVPA